MKSKKEEMKKESAKFRVEYMQKGKYEDKRVYEEKIIRSHRKEKN
jgi:hypothetical protein